MFSLDGALAYARQLPRFRYRNLTQRMPTRGPFVPQFAIPLATRSQVNRAVAIMEQTRRGSRRLMKTVWIDLADIRSEQMALRIDKLLWQLRHYGLMQRKRRPGVIMARGIPVLWDGNHRITSGLLLGKKRMRCDLYYDPTECERTLDYIKRGGRK
jgi:hypothetical protein